MYIIGFRLKVGAKVYRVYSLYVFDRITKEYLLLHGGHVRYNGLWLGLNEFKALQERLGKTIIEI